MNTTVLMVDPVDLGAGAENRVTYMGCRWHVDGVGTLHVIAEQGKGNVAAFAAGHWQAVTDGSRSVVATEVRS